MTFTSTVPQSKKENCHPVVGNYSLYIFLAKVWSSFWREETIPQISKWAFSRDTHSTFSVAEDIENVPLDVSAGFLELNIGPGSLFLRGVTSGKAWWSKPLLS